MNIPDIRIYISSESTPNRILIGATPNLNDAMSGSSVLYSSTAGATWVDGSGVVDSPVFEYAHGRNNAVLLYDTSGNLGGNVEVTDDFTLSIPFWVQYRLDENTTSPTGFARLNVMAGEGPLGNNGSSTNGTSGSTDNGITYYNNPAVDTLRYLGALSPGTTTVTSGNGDNKIYFRFAGDEQLEYVLNFGPGQGNVNGLMRISETNSSSFPVYNAGLKYLTSAGVLIEPTGLTGTCTMNQLRILGSRVVATYTDTFEGTHTKKYTWGLEGKSLRVKMECTDGRTPYSGNYNTAHFGIATGCDTPRIVEMPGIGMAPVASFFNSFIMYYIGKMADLTQSHAYQYVVPDPATVTFTGSIVNHDYNLYYRNTTGNYIVNNVDETFLVCVSTKPKDVLISSSAPKSPFYDQAKDKFSFVFAPGSTPPLWDGPSYTIRPFIDKIYSWGFENVAWIGYRPDGTTPVGQFSYPTIDSSNFNTLVSISNNYGYLGGTYTIYNSVKTGGPNFNTTFGTGICSMYDYNHQPTWNGGLGVYKTGISTRTGTASFVVNAAYIKDVVRYDSLLLKNGYDVTAAYYDVDPVMYPLNSWLGGPLPTNTFDSMDQGSGRPDYAKNLRDGIIGFKKAFDTPRQVFDSPLWGEGGFCSYDSDMPWLFNGYVDGTQRGVCTNGITSQPLAQNQVSGYLRSPTNYWTVPEYEWRVLQPVAPNIGVGLENKFFSPSDYDVAYRKTGVWTYNDMLPFTTGAFDRLRAFMFLYARAGFLSMNNGTEGVGCPTYEQIVTHYYMTNAMQQRMFSAPVDTINYYSAGQWQSFDDIYYFATGMNAFTGVGININLTNGFRMWINQNHATGNSLTVTKNSTTWQLPRDGFFAYTDDGNFVAFNGATSGLYGNTTGNVIEYVKCDDYEFFHGKTTPVRGFGNISTSGSNASQMKLYNYNRGITVYSTTGSSTYPTVNVVSGYI